MVKKTTTTTTQLAEVRWQGSPTWFFFFFLYPVSAFSMIVIREKVQVVDDWLTATLDCQGDGSINGTNQSQIRRVRLVAFLQIRRLKKERTIKWIEQVWYKMAPWRNIFSRPWQLTHKYLHTHACNSAHPHTVYCTHTHYTSPTPVLTPDQRINWGGTEEGEGGRKQNTLQ